jgi:hypothetical protein
MRRAIPYGSDPAFYGVISTNLVEGIVGTVPLIQHLLNEILTVFKTETNGLLVRPAT